MSEQGKPSKTVIALVSPTVLAYRLCYWVNQSQKGDKRDDRHSDFFRITKKGLEALAVDKNTAEL
ncbi:hypothetical protein DKL61_01070 [Gammaproteobacteria bacterium ESL0073]|nr:hypothetical protein DKL61_01070 [Gammaproteobacteria bacterium ESL0073]